MKLTYLAIEAGLAELGAGLELAVRPRARVGGAAGPACGAGGSLRVKRDDSNLSGDVSRV